MDNRMIDASIKRELSSFAVKSQITITNRNFNPDTKTEHQPKSWQKSIQQKSLPFYVNSSQASSQPLNWKK